MASRNHTGTVKPESSDCQVGWNGPGSIGNDCRNCGDPMRSAAKAVMPNNARHEVIWNTAIASFGRRAGGALLCHGLTAPLIASPSWL